MAKMYQDYIGDGVYVSFDGYQIWLAANNPNNDVVALEPHVFARLLEYVERLKKKIAEDSQGDK